MTDKLDEYIKGVHLIFQIPAEYEEATQVVDYPFEQIQSCVSEEDIPRYTFGLERQVKQEMSVFKDTMELINMNIQNQRRTVKRHATTAHQSISPIASPTSIPRSFSTPVPSSHEGPPTGGLSTVEEEEPHTRIVLPSAVAAAAARRRQVEEEQKPTNVKMGGRWKGLFLRKSK